MKYLKEITKIKFPKPKDLNINMMPFIMGDSNSIPKNYHQYIPLIEACNLPSLQIGKVGYLSISESNVSSGKSQRRDGIHVERYSDRHSWGGFGPEEGLYISSNVEKSCRAWDDYIEIPDIQDLLENPNEYKEFLQNPIFLEKDTIYWLTDGTPHEALPVEKSCYRQWFRVVTSNVGIWFREDSTLNPLGVIPPKNVRIIEKSKFEFDALEDSW